MTIAMLLAGFLTLGGVVSVIWLAFALVRLHIRRRRGSRSLGAMSERWLTMYRVER